MTDPVEQKRPRVAAVVCSIIGTSHWAKSSQVGHVMECIDSVRANRYEPLEVIVVDQSPSDVLRVALHNPIQRDSRLRYIYTELPGLTRAQNLAIRNSDADIFAFTDDDCIVPVDWIESIVAMFQRHPDAGIAFGSVFPPPDHDWRTAYVPRLEWDAEVRLQPTFLPRVHSLMGADMAVRRETFERIGLFEDAFCPGPSNGEPELVLRATRATPPVAVYLTPTISVVHQYGARPAGPPTRRLLNTYHMGSAMLVTTHALRGDLGAVCKLGIMAFEPLVDTIRSRKPSGLTKVVPYLRGIYRGVEGVMRRGAGRPARLEPHRDSATRADG